MTGDSLGAETGGRAANGEHGGGPDEAPGRFGIVVIGRNEGARLTTCLASVRQAVHSAGVNARFVELVYVDSHSSDDSVDRARAQRAQVVELDPALPMTAARARNAGFARLREIAPTVEYVQFVDGDCELEPAWLEVALAFMDESPEFSVVCGRRRERFPDASVFNRLCDLEWNTLVGEARSCGGDSLMRCRDFSQVGGFASELIAGEEPELCFRLRQQGGRVMRLAQDMTWHDAAMSRPMQWVRRTERAGHAAAEMAARHGRDVERPGVKQTVSNVTWGMIVPGALASLGLAGATPLALGVAAGAYGRLFWSSYRYERSRPDPRSPEEARLYAASCVVGKVPAAWGAVSYFRNLLQGRQSRLVEYKGVKES